MDSMMKNGASIAFSGGSVEQLRGHVETLQGHAEAIMGSSHIWASGCQSIGHSMATAAHAHVERTMSMWKSLSGAKSIQEAIELQMSFARTSMQIALTETGKLTGTSMKLAEQTMAPITARMAFAAEKFGNQVGQVESVSSI